MPCGVGEGLAGQRTGPRPADLWLTAADMRAALEIPDDKTHCVLLGEDVIRRLQEQVAT